MCRNDQFSLLLVDYSYSLKRTPALSPYSMHTSHPSAWMLILSALIIGPAPPQPVPRPEDFSSAARISPLSAYSVPLLNR